MLDELASVGRPSPSRSATSTTSSRRRPPRRATTASPHGCSARRSTPAREPVLAREMLGWDLIKSGAEGGRARLRRVARRTARRCGPSCSRWAMRGPTRGCRSARCRRSTRRSSWPSASTGAVLDRARVERKAEREESGLPADEDDRLARSRGPECQDRSRGHSRSPLAERAAAVARWPELAADFDHPGGYSRRMEEQLRRLRSALNQRPRLAPIVVEALVDGRRRRGTTPTPERPERLRGLARGRRPRDLVATGSQRPVLVRLRPEVQALLRTRLTTRYHWYPYLMRVTSKGQVTIPLEVREALGIRPGADVRFEMDGDGARLKVAPEDAGRPSRRCAVPVSKRFRPTRSSRSPDGEGSARHGRRQQRPARRLHRGISAGWTGRSPT